jgi:GT2 family glycosyltransferase
MTFTVLVPSYRRPDALRKCLEGLFAGARLPEEIVVTLRDIDQDSQARFAQWIAEEGFVPAGLALRHVIADRPGQIVAMNAGLAAATGDVVCFIDDDCVPRADWLQHLAQHYEDPQVGGVGGRDVVHHGEMVSAGSAASVGRLSWYGRIIGNHHMELAGGPVQADHLKGANMSFRRALMQPFDECLSGGSCCLNDTDASLHVRDQGYRLIYDPGMLVDHYPAARFDESTRVITDPKLVYSDSHNWVYCLFKHFGPVQRWLFLTYALLVGGGNRHGLLKWLLALPRGPRAATAQFWAATRGKIAGARTFCRQARDHAAP